MKLLLADVVAGEQVRSRGSEHVSQAGGGRPS